MHSFTTHTKYTHIYLYIALQETSNSFFVNRQQQNIAIIRSDDNDDIIIFVLDLHRLIHGLHLLSLNTEDQKYWVGKHSNHISYKGTQFHPKAYTYNWDKIYHSIHLHTSGIFVWSGEEEYKNLGLEWISYKIIPNNNKNERLAVLFQLELDCLLNLSYGIETESIVYQIFECINPLHDYLCQLLALEI